MPARVVSEPGRHRPAAALRGPGLTLPRLIAHNVLAKPVRLAFAALAVAIGVLAVATFSVVSHSLRSSELAVMQIGRADFTVAEKGTSDILNSNIDQATLQRLRGEPGVASAIGVLIGTTRLNADNPQFLEIGIAPGELAGFGVTVVAGRPFAATAEHAALLGYRAAANLGLRVGDTLVLDHRSYRIAGLYATGQALGDTGVMLPLAYFQTTQRQPGELTLLFVRTAPGTDVGTLRRRVEAEFPQLVTVRTAADFGRADRSLALISAGESGSTVLAVVVGAVVVMATMTITFVERTREFGILAAIGWPARRIVGMVVSEAMAIGLIGAVAGIAMSFAATRVLDRLPGLVGILHPDYTASAFWRAVLTAAAMSLLGGILPALRAARLAPLDALSHE